MNGRDSSGGLGVSSSSGGASPVLLVRHRQRRQHRPRAKSQTQLSPNVNYFDDRAGSRISAGDSSAASTRPVSLNDEHTSAAAIINASLIEHNKQLMEDLFELKRQLKLKDDEIEKLVGVRNQLDSEMQELSASLFEVVWYL